MELNIKNYRKNISILLYVSILHFQQNNVFSMLKIQFAFSKKRMIVSSGIKILVVCKEYCNIWAWGHLYSFNT